MARDLKEAARYFKMAAQSGIGTSALKAEESLCISEAEAGDPASQLKVARMYEQRYNASEAVKWYAKAATQDNEEAEQRLYTMYVNGKGIAHDPVEASKWLRKLAEHGDKEYQWLLGQRYYAGIGLAKSGPDAAFWMTKAAVQGHRDAQIRLATMYANGDGVPRNPEEAKKWQNGIPLH